MGSWRIGLIGVGERRRGLIRLHGRLCRRLLACPGAGLGLRWRCHRRRWPIGLLHRLRLWNSRRLRRLRL